MSERGEIRNRRYAKQICDFSGMLFENNISPSDIDVFIDFGNKAFVFIEIKYGNNEMPWGQRLALERLCDACWNCGLGSIVLIARHNYDSDKDIDLANCLVSEVRFDYKWEKITEIKTVRKAIDDFKEKYAPLKTKKEAEAEKPHD